MTESFGAIISGADVREAVVDTIKLWQATYLAEIERQTARLPASLPLIRSFTAATEFDHWPEDQLPGAVVVAPGLADQPRRSGDGRLEGTWVVGVAVVTSGQDRTGSITLCELYVAAVRAMLLQHPSLGGFAESTQWVDERYDDLADDARTMAAGTLQLLVTVPNILDLKKGPADVPPDDPYALPTDWPSIETVFVQVDAEA